MKKNYHTGPNKMYQSQGQSLPEARTLHFGQCEGSIKAETCIPPKRVMTGNKELGKQWRPWLQIYTKIYLVYGRQALESQRKICPNSIIYFCLMKMSAGFTPREDRCCSQRC